MSKRYLNPMLLCDFYKISHREQYPDKTEVVYSTWTPRASKIEGITEVVSFGAQGFIKEYLIDFFDENFFKRDRNEILAEYTRFIKFTLGVQNPPTDHIRDLHALGYLPLRIRALKEGTRVPLRVPMMTIENTDFRFPWLTNYIETMLSSEIWKPSTVATIADQYRKQMNAFADETADSREGVEFLCHDFSMRGMSGVEDAAKAGLGHLLSFVGTDTIPAINRAEAFYNANIETELVGTSIPATEHSVMCAYGRDQQFEAYKRIITEVYPTGFVSIVSDTWNLWEVLSDIIKPLKEDILKRDGKVVIRPDSGDPVLIVCGDPDGKTEDERKGVIEILWDIFGGTINSKGYKVLDSHIGSIYGDSINLARNKEIMERLKAKGFASTNQVYGIGSYSYQFITRDTFGFAVKSTQVQIDGKGRAIYKDPITDDGTKKSAKGKVAVCRGKSGQLYVIDGLELGDQVTNDLLERIYEDGELLRDQSLAEIRGLLASTRG